MGSFLNSTAPYENYIEIVNSPFFVDKSLILAEIINLIGTPSKYICVTRPRRFGKTVMANMIGAFFCRNEVSRKIFATLKIADLESYDTHLNKHDVIYIDFSEVPENCISYEQYVNRISEGLKMDLAAAYPEIQINSKRAIWDILSDLFETSRKKFIFVMDEWDALFHMSFATDANKQSFLLFLKSLLKSKAYVELAYMTGILPIAKYSDGSELNMFLEYNMATKIKFSEYFGFLDDEVDDLYDRYLKNTKNPRMTREDLRIWYDGYYTAAGERMYNPRSIVCALTDNQLANYWTSSGTYDSIFGYLKDNIADVQDDLALMFSGESVPADIQEYAATSMVLRTRDEIYSAMVVYGLLTYEDGYVSIPNKELMDSFASMMKKEASLGYVYRLANASLKMLNATLNGDTDTMCEILQYAHNTETPILSYNNETELSAIVNLVYLSARDRYRIEREDKAGKGYVDFIFYPEKKHDDCIILELKVDHSPEDAIAQIIEKQYSLRFKGKLGEVSKYKGRILAVGISYNKVTKAHSCKVEILE